MDNPCSETSGLAPTHTQVSVEPLRNKNRIMDHHEDDCRVGGDHHGKQDGEEAVARLEEFKKSMEAKMALRRTNLNPERPG
ncbi:Regulator of nonsense transcripts UPF2 [Vitis vinifera]|uniref:Regulator of nonsense transcripts UPF2 n=1 Tax=Vitis vinifera TaxID=29760 RepID=A0A438FLL5_VITVI|nr:Regulator of nonsense transcripts UPF2 [Vitis vinifera]